MKISDATHKYGWDVNTYLSALGTELPNMDASVFFVDSTASQALDANDGEHGNTWDKPFATIDYAVGKCTASAGDIILVAPGHSESKAATGVLVTCDVAGVSIIGKGSGAIRPTIALSGHTGAVAFSVTAASVKIQNILITNAIDALVSAISVAAADCSIEDVEVRDGANTTEVAIGILTTTAANRLKIKRYFHNGFVDGDACTQAISLVATANTEIADSRFFGTFSTSAVNIATASTGLIVKNCSFRNGTTALTTNVVDTATGSTWSAINCWDEYGGYSFSGGSGATLATDDTSSVSSQTTLLYTTAAGTGVYPTGVTNDSILAMLLSKSATAAASSYNNTTDSLEAIRDQIDTLNLADQVDLDAILLDTGTTIPATITTMQNDLDTLTGATGANLLTATQASIDAIEADTSAWDTSTKARTLLAGSDTPLATEATLTAISTALAVSSPTFSNANYLAVSTGTFDTTGTWSTAASHEIATITGMVKMLVIPVCTASVSSVSDTGTISLGDETTADSIIAASTLGSGAMVAGELWVDATLTRTILTQTQLNALTFVVANGKDIGYTVGTNALSGGAITFHIWWTPLDATGAVVAGSGGTLA
jgi:hypothetical protein